MKTQAIIRKFVVGCLLMCVTATPGPVRAAEEVSAFLAALRERRYYEVALEYLDKMANSPLASSEFKELVLYNKGVTLVEASRYERDFGLRGKQLDQAQQLFKQFVTERATHPMVSQANTQLANLLVERARMNLAMANQNPEKKEALRAESRKLYDEARAVFQTSAENLKAELEGIPKVLPPTATAQIERRKQLRADYLQAQVLVAAIVEEMADTHDEGSKEYKDKLLEAANGYKTIYEKYRTRLAGLYARMYQGRCYVKIKDYKEALTYLSSLLDQPSDTPELRKLRAKTLVQAVACWLGDEQPKYVEAIEKIAPFVDKATPVEEQQRDFISMKLSLARAYKVRGDDVKKENPKAADVKRSYDEARKLATAVAKIPGEFKKPAQDFLSSLPGAVATDDSGKPDPKTFAEARTVGKEVFANYQVAQATAEKLSSDLQTEKDPAAKAEIKKNFDAAVETLNTSRADAMKYFGLALDLADLETPTEEINNIQYYLCWLYYTQEKYHEAAILGELLAHRYPQSAGARSAASIAMVCYQQLYHLSQDEEKKFETNRLVAIADRIVQRWPSEKEAIQARKLLISLMISQQQLDKAMSYLQDIPEDSAERGQAELNTGQAFWNAFLRGMQEVRASEKKISQWQKDGVPPGASIAEEQNKIQTLEGQLDNLKEQAEATLANGISRMQKTGKVDETLAAASLSLAQIYVDTEQSGKAVALLEDADIGALQLVKKKHAAASKEVFIEETYKTALRSYISSLASNEGNADDMVAKAKAIMQALKSSVGDTPEGQQKLVNTYLSLAQQLNAQIGRASGNAKAGLLKGFETFLLEVGSETKELNILNWVAETFAGMGKEVDTGTGQLSTDAKNYYTRASGIYQKILDGGRAGTLQVDDNLQTQIRMRLAMTKRRLKEFSDALKEFQAILLDPENNRMLNVQVEAAQTYEDWGAATALPPTGKYSGYDYAIFGGRRDRRATVDGKQNPNRNKNTIWGWGKIAQMSANAMQRTKQGTPQWDSFRNTFHQARYHIALCHYQMGVRKGKESSSQQDKEKYLALAKKDISVTQKLFPELGGTEWKPQYDTLLKRIQKELGEKQVGLAALDSTAKG